MKIINLLYIDDEPDITISEYLDTYVSDKSNIIYKELTFKNNDTYETLINNIEVKKADVIIIDLRLFENSNVITKFSGEEFKMILKKIFPYKEVLVVTQNYIKDGMGTLSKFDSKTALNKKNFYDLSWRPKIEEMIENVLIFYNLSSEMNLNQGIDKNLVNEIYKSLEGSSEYSCLTKDDIDKLIISFETLRKKYHE